MDEVHGENYAIYAQSGKPLAYLFVDPTHEHHTGHIESIKPIAAMFREKLNFVCIDAIKFGDHAKALNLAEPKWPSFVVQDLNKQLKYPFQQSESPDPEEIKRFIEDFLAGKLEPQLKSQAIPEVQSENVYTVVGKSFEDVVFDDSKDVFIELYASW